MHEKRFRDKSRSYTQFRDYYPQKERVSCAMLWYHYSVLWGLVTLGIQVNQGRVKGWG